MFSIFDIDDRITIFERAAQDLEEKADLETDSSFGAQLLRAHACGFRQAAHSLERMIEFRVEREAIEAMRP